MKRLMAFLSGVLLLVLSAAPMHAQYYGHHDNFRSGAYRGGRGGSYGYNTPRGHVDDNGRYHPNGIGPGKGAAIGAAGGAVLGALFGGGLKGAVVGGAVGAGVGAVAGKAHQDNQRRGCYYYGHC